MSDLPIDHKDRASTWFRSLRDDIVAAFEEVEQTHPGDAPVGKFEVSETKRASEDGSDAGGGLMSVMRGGRVFEKVGVNVSAVYGTLGERAQKAMAARGVPGMAEDPRFWASGISLVAHMQNPRVPAVHMNTRMFWTPGAWWFGGGSDLNPAIEYVNESVLHRVVIAEGTKAYHTKEVDKENNFGLFTNYKKLSLQVSKVVTELSPSFPYPRTLASNLFEMANNHIYFAQHLPKLTDVSVTDDNFDEVKKMLEFFAFKLLCK